jgi:hypothetical protein
MDNMHNSWKLEKIIDEKGKSNYKLVTENNTNKETVIGSSSRKHKAKRNAFANHRPIGAYGVPGANAYLNTKATTLHSPTLNSNIIKSIKRIKKKPSFQYKEEQSETSSKTARTGVEINMERFASINGKIYNNMIIGNNGLIIPYGTGNDLVQKSFQHGHLVTSSIHLENINILISYFGPKVIPCLTVSVWSQVLSPTIELTNIFTIPVQNIQPNHGKVIIREFESDVVTKGQIFLTVNSTEDYDGKIDIKYNLEVTPIYDNRKEAEFEFEFPDFFNNGGFGLPTKFITPIVEQQPVVVQAPAPSAAPVQAPLPVAAKVTTPIINYPKKTNKSIFGDFIKGQNEQNVPIFGKKQEDRDANEGSISLNQSIYANQAIKAAGLLIDGGNDDAEIDFTERDDTDINKILNILRNQNYDN